MEYRILWLIAILLYAANANDKSDWGKSTKEMAETYGYLCEEHKVTTQDGYILTIFRIPGKKTSQPGKSKKVPLIIQPGASSSSDLMVFAGPPYAPAFYFADRDYDVWLVNRRGGTYGKEHKWLSVKSQRFWNFTFEEQGIYDTPCYLDYISNITGYQKVHFLGNSQGCTQTIVGLTLLPEYFSKRILSFAALSPVMSLNRLISFLTIFLEYTHILSILEFFGVYEFQSFNPTAGMIYANLASLFPGLIKFILNLCFDRETTHMNMDRMSTFASRYPCGTSTKCMKHTMQMYEFKGLYRYREHKDSPLIPYDYSKIPATLPIFMLGGQADIMAEPSSVIGFYEKLLSLNKNVILRIYPHLGHAGMVNPKNEEASRHLKEIDLFFKSISPAKRDFNLLP